MSASAPRPDLDRAGTACRNASIELADELNGTPQIWEEEKK